MTSFHREQIVDSWLGCLKNMEKDDTVIFLHHQSFEQSKMLSVMNNEELKIQAKLWRKQIKSGLVECHDYNNKEHEIDGKKYYTLVIQSKDCPLDPLGLFVIGEMVSGYIYCFEIKTNRDIIYKYINN